VRGEELGSCGCFSAQKNRPDRHVIKKKKRKKKKTRGEGSTHTTGRQAISHWGMGGGTAEEGKGKCNPQTPQEEQVPVQKGFSP